MKTPIFSLSTKKISRDEFKITIELHHQKFIHAITTDQSVIDDLDSLNQDAMHEAENRAIEIVLKANDIDTEFIKNWQE